MISTLKFNSGKITLLLLLFCTFFTNSPVCAQRSYCKDCAIYCGPTAIECPKCKTPFNLCLECNHKNPANADYCHKCKAPLAEMRVLGSIASSTRDELKLGKSTRAQLERELLKVNHLLSEEPEKEKVHLFRKGKILKQIGFYARETKVWRKYLKYYPNSRQATFVKVYLSDSLRKWSFLFYSQGKKEKALEMLKESVKVNPMNLQAWEWLGRTNMELSFTKDAISAYEKALYLSPENQTYKHFLKKLKK